MGSGDVACISLWQPWATLLAAGIKTIETRSWSTRHRGTLLIHASASWSAAQRKYTDEILDGRSVDLPRGALVGVVQLDDCVPTEAAQASRLERSLGDFTPGRWAWLTSQQRPLAAVRWAGRQGLFRISLAELMLYGVRPLDTVTPPSESSRPSCGVHAALRETEEQAPLSRRTMHMVE